MELWHPPLPPVYLKPTCQLTAVANEERFITVGIPVLGCAPGDTPLATEPIKCRGEVNARLVEAVAGLPAGFCLVVLGGYCQTPGESLCPCRTSHTTGGAVDVTLSWHGIPLALGTDYPSTDESAQLNAFEQTAGPVRDLRRLLATHLFEHGMVPDPAAWWHWSYGDARWAVHFGTLPRYEAIGEAEAARHAE